MPPFAAAMVRTSPRRVICPFAAQPQPQRPAPPGYKRRSKAAAAALGGKPAGHCLPRAAVIAHRHLHCAGALGVQPQSQPERYRSSVPSSPTSPVTSSKGMSVPRRRWFASPARGWGLPPQRLSVPQIKLSAGAGHLAGADILLRPGPARYHRPADVFLPRARRCR